MYQQHKFELLNFKMIGIRVLTSTKS